MNKLLFTGWFRFPGIYITPLLYKEYDLVHTLILCAGDDINVDLAKEVSPINTHYDIVLHACSKAHVVFLVTCLGEGFS